MKTIKTRSGVFETNSSSSHSLVLSFDHSNMIDPPIPESMLDEGLMHIFPGEYGWEQETYYDVQSKLSYLYVDAMRGYYDKDLCESMVNDPDFIKDNDKLQMIVSAVLQHAGVNTHFHIEEGIYPFGYIDHQSNDTCEPVWSDGIDGVIRFVFSNNSHFVTDNDNH